ncbi:MAG: outer membrane beta-barrel protein [Phycisphaerales bacterium]|nr:outer membrane beta-barrel protein [Phycisphaerales bacterium]MCB9837044.1 outer membrane beta-barrel protein [Phycisphaera sp.]
MRMTLVCVGAMCAVVAGGAIADEGDDNGRDESLRERTGGLLTAESFQPYADEAEVYGSGPYPSIYIRGAAALVFPFDTEVETTSFGNDLELNSKIGVGYNVGAGIRLGPGPNPADPGVGYRFEGEFAQRFYDTDDLINDDGDSVQDIDGNIEVTMIMGNILFDVCNEGYRGYLGFGAGVAMVDAEIDGTSDSDTSFALQIPVGVEIRVIDNVWIDVGTRWVYIPGLEFQTDIEEMSILTADVHVGLVVEF